MNTFNKVLYIEDDPDIQTIATMAFAFGGFVVEPCTSGRMALDKIGGFHPDLILIDVMMPEMDGPSTLKAIRALPDFSTTPIVFMTAKVQAHEVESYKKLGAVAVITKPFDPMTLCDDLKKIWKQNYVG